jgi:hypothetical protein
MSAKDVASRKGLTDSRLGDLEEAWKAREIEAEALKEACHGTMALALRLYCLEIRLKTFVCSTLKLKYLPEACKTHELDRVLNFTGLHAELEDPSNILLKKNWDALVHFSRERLNNVRYLPASQLSPAELIQYESALDDSTNGVWTWLSKHH